MRNKELLLSKLGQLEGKIKATRVLITRPNTTEELHATLDIIDNLLEDINSIVERDL